MGQETIDLIVLEIDSFVPVKSMQARVYAGLRR